MARIIEGVKETKTLLYAHDAAVEAGDVIVAGGLVLIAINDADADALNAYAFSCRAALGKATGEGEAIAAPAKVFWDASGEVATETPTGNTPLGITIEDAEDADDEVIVDVDPRVFVTGAANIELADSGGFTDEEDVEAALQEIYPKVAAVIADPGDAGAIAVTRSGQCAITTADAETRTLAVPTFAGQKLTISMDVDGGDCVITAAAAINQTGNNTITLDDAGDCLALEGVQVGGALVWRILNNDGATLTTV